MTNTATRRILPTEPTFARVTGEGHYKGVITESAQGGYEFTYTDRKGNTHTTRRFSYSWPVACEGTN